MKKTIVYITKQAIKHTQEVELPCYFKAADIFDSGNGYDVWLRVNEDLSSVEITRHYREDEWEDEWEISFNKASESVGQYFDSSYYKPSSAEAFNKALAELKAAVDGI